jgi:hypothetical protein
MAWCGGPGVDHGQKQDPGGRMVTWRLTRDGPLQKHRYMQVEAIAELLAPELGTLKLPPLAA